MGTVEPLDDPTARRAGSLLGAAGDGPSPVDATVAEVAIRRGGAVVTSDRRHLTMLAAAARRRVEIIDL